MEVSPKTLREVEFREKMRGYHPEDVDHFLEQVAAGIEVLQDRLRQAVERAQRAEAAAAEAGGTDDTLRKTLLLAQRTADLAVQEAREQASRILASAEQQAQMILADAEDRGRKTLEDTIAECRSELSRLESNRSQAQQDVETLHRWLDEHKAHLQASLSEAMAAVERAGVLWPAPNTRPADQGRRTPPPPALPPESNGVATSPPSPGFDADNGPETVAWTPPAEDRADPPGPAPDRNAGSVTERNTGSGPERNTGSVPERNISMEPTRLDLVEDKSLPDSDNQAMNDFFDDNDEFADDRRFGGRLRRRR